MPGCRLLVGVLGLVLWVVAAPGRAIDALPPVADPRLSPSPGGPVVTEREWAARLVEALDLAPLLSPDHGPDEIYSLLCPDRAERRVESGGRRMPARPAFRAAVHQPRASAGAPLRMVVQVPATALYALRVTGRGASRWSVDRRAIGAVDASPLGVDVADSLVPLTRGPHELEGELGRGTDLQRVELNAHRPLCIAPSRGWRGDRTLDFGAKARTLVRAFAMEGRLPSEGEPLVIEGEDWSRASASAERSDRALPAPASSNAWARVAGEPAELQYRLVLEDPGLFSVLARVHGVKRQLWSVDGRYEMPVDPPPAAAEFAWTEVGTLALDAGEHVVRVRLADGAGLDLMRLVRRRTRDEDYLRVLEELGFREGAPTAAVTASDARRNLRHPGFRQLTANLLQRISGPPGSGIALVERESDRLYGRPLSPILPAEL